GEPRPMVNRNLLRRYDPPEGEQQQELDAGFGDPGSDWLTAEDQLFRENRIVTGTVLRAGGDGVWIDIGYKSEGVIELREPSDDLGQVVPPKPGDRIELLLEAVEDEDGAIVLSYRKARGRREWEAFLAAHKEGDVVSGPVTRKVKGGLLVHIGVHVFLP